MFADIYARRIDKCEKAVVDDLLNSFENNEWDNVYVDEITKDDYGSYIQIVKACDIHKMARNMVDTSNMYKNVNSNFILNKKHTASIQLINLKTKRKTNFKIMNDVDLIFLKRRTLQPSDVIKVKNDPLRSWCNQFLDSYATTESVDESMESTPSYKPTQSQITKLQNKRNRDLMNWGSNF